MCEPTVFQSALFKPYATKARTMHGTTQETPEDDGDLLLDMPVYVTRTGKFLSTNEMRERTRTVNCKHWLRGFCKYGDACNFVHPIKQQSHTRTREKAKVEEEGVKVDTFPVEFTEPWRDQQADDVCVMRIARRVQKNLCPNADKEDFREAMDREVMSCVSCNHIFRLIASIDRVSDRITHKNRKTQNRKRKRRRKRISGAVRHARNSENRVLREKVRAEQEVQANQIELESFPDLDMSDDVFGEFDSACEVDTNDLMCLVQKSQTLGESHFAARKVGKEPANPLNFLLNV